MTIELEKGHISKHLALQSFLPSYQPSEGFCSGRKLKSFPVPLMSRALSKTQCFPLYSRAKRLLVKVG